MPDLNKWNQWGGSLSIGHPFAATGVRFYDFMIVISFFHRLFHSRSFNIDLVSSKSVIRSFYSFTKTISEKIFSNEFSSLGILYVSYKSVT